jgi:plasmid rolling circle replication initiator protein Rep
VGSVTLAEFEAARARRKEASERVAATLAKATQYHKYGMQGLSMRAARIAKCGEFYAGDVCPVCGTFHATHGSRCRDRLCPSCGWALASERSIAVKSALDQLGQRYAIFHVVLTKQDPIESDGTLLHQNCKELVDAYTRMVHTDKKFKAHVWGTVRALEISDNGKAKYHPHIHALWVQKIPDPPQGRMLTHDEVCDIWQKALRVDYRPICWIEAIYAKGNTNENALTDAVCEACKYVIKPSLYEGADTEKLVELAEGVKSIHMFQATGGMAALYRKAVKEIETERDLPKGLCPSCGAMTEHVTMNWQDGGYTL